MLKRKGNAENDATAVQARRIILKSVYLVSPAARGGR